MEPPREVSWGSVLRKLFVGDSVNHPNPYDYLPEGDSTFIRIDLRDLINAPEIYFEKKAEWLSSGEGLKWEKLPALRAFLQARNFKEARKSEIAYSYYVKRGKQVAILLRHDWLTGEANLNPVADLALDRQREFVEAMRHHSYSVDALEVAGTTIKGRKVVPQIAQFYSYDFSELKKYSIELSETSRMNFVTNEKRPDVLQRFIAGFDFAAIKKRDQ